VNGPCGVSARADKVTIPSALRRTAARGRRSHIIALVAALAVVFAPSVVAPARPAVGAPAQQQTPTPVTLDGVLRPFSSASCPSVQYRLEPCDGGAPVLIGSSLSLADYANLAVAINGRSRSCPGGGSYVDVTGISPHPCASPTTVASDPNLALGKPVQIPPGNPDQNGGRINDGDTASLWRATGGASWLYIDLQSEQNVHKFVFRWGAAYAKRFGVYMWDPGNGPSGDWSALYYTPEGKGGDETVVVPLVRAQVFLLYLVEPSNPDIGFELGEWEVYGSAVTNLARGHHIEASTERPLNPARHAVDGDESTAWHGEAARRMTQPTWLRVIYAPLRADISAVRILWAGGYALKYRVHFRVDGEWLKAQFSLENDRPDFPNVVSWRFPLSVDEVWVVVDESDPNHDYVGIRELELYAQPPSDQALQFATSLDPRRALIGDVVVQGARLRASGATFDGIGDYDASAADAPSGTPPDAAAGSVK